MKTALVLVDIQNDYFPGGSMELDGSIEAGRRAGQLLSAFREWRLPLIHVQHVSLRPGSTFFLPDTEGVKIHEKVRPLEGEVVIQKHYPNSFRDTGLLRALQERQVGRLVIAGMMTHMCIDATTRAAFDFGFECWVAADACATRALMHQGRSIPAEAVHCSFLAALSTAYARVLGTDEIVSQLSADDPASFLLQPIGTVHSMLRRREECPHQGWEGAPEAWLEIAPAFLDALDGIVPGSEIIVLTWFHEAARQVLKVHPRGNPARPLRGVFSTRSPDRPNPIGLHRVEVLEIVGGNRLRVRPLEALNQTPVIDLKPVLPMSADM